MRAAISALPLLLIVHFGPFISLGTAADGEPWQPFVFDVYYGSKVLYVERLVLVLALGAFTVWLAGKAEIPAWLRNVKAGCATLAIWGVFLAYRPVAIPLIWTLELAILAGLIWWLVAEWSDPWKRWFIGWATVFHGISALFVYPISQIALGGLGIPPENFKHAADHVIGPIMGSVFPLVFFGSLFVLSWGVYEMVTAFSRKRR